MKGNAVLKRAMLVGVGAVAGWYGSRLFSKGRDVAAIKAEETLKTTFTPENIGKTVGAATATATAEGVKSFINQLRDEVPAWRQSAENQVPKFAQHDDVIESSATVHRQARDS